MADLQVCASDPIAEATGAKIGFITPGASPAMLLGTVACIAGDAYATMACLDSDGSADDESS